MGGFMVAVRVLFVFAFLLDFICGDAGQPQGNPPSGNQGGNPGGQHNHGSGSGGKLEVVISFDSMHCPSMQFFQNQLKPIYEEMSQCVQWHFIPCSTSQIVDDVLKCCGGVAACQIDVLHACAAHYYENDEYKLGKFFLCMVPDDAQYVKGEACAKEAGLDWKLLNACQPTKEAGTWCDNRFKQLNKLHEPKIPGVLYNMHYDAAAEAESLSCLKTGICNQIKKQGGQCAACGNSGSGGGSPGSGNPPSGHPPSGNPPSGHPPSGNPPSGNPPSGNPPNGHPPSGNPPPSPPPPGGC
ncbi:uncharacterized protein LOC135842986 [Planococcus citri]|uniref:uncharacterized protein LOC135842986 n=1 Tax=Planococcus citri TaxID=170843 RepID=UPI0031F744F1